MNNPDTPTIGTTVTIGKGISSLTYARETTTAELLDVRDDPTLKPYVVRRADTGKVEYHNEIRTADDVQHGSVQS